MRRVFASRQLAMPAPSGRISLIPPKFSRYHRGCWRRASPLHGRHADRDAPDRLDTIAEAPVTSETEAVISSKAGHG